MRVRSTPQQVQGDSAEQIACEFLEKRSLLLVARNYRCRAGELDLIMRDQDMWVFVEVRYRRSLSFGTAVESVNYTKQQRLMRAANYYLQEKRLAEKVSSRFDIVALQSSSNGPMKVEWIKNAFESNLF